MARNVANRTGIKDAIRKSFSELREKNLCLSGSKGPPLGFHECGPCWSSLGLPGSGLSYSRVIISVSVMEERGITVVNVVKIPVKVPVGRPLSSKYVMVEICVGIETSMGSSWTGPDLVVGAAFGRLGGSGGFMVVGVDCVLRDVVVETNGMSVVMVVNDVVPSLVTGTVSVIVEVPTVVKEVMAIIFVVHIMLSLVST